MEQELRFHRELRSEHVELSSNQCKAWTVGVNGRATASLHKLVAMRAQQVHTILNVSFHQFINCAICEAQ
jgi:aerobic-type carbon monoxide dehydrogenase small subunit (CoxS/CutS family)